MRCKRALQARIDELLLDNNLSLNALAKTCGMKQSTLFNIMCGRNDTIRLHTILRICTGLGIDLPTFFDSDLFRDVEQEVV